MLAALIANDALRFAVEVLVLVVAFVWGFRSAGSVDDHGREAVPGKRMADAGRRPKP